MIRRLIPILLSALTVLCCGRPGVKGFWNRHEISFSDIRAAEDQFADFAELASAAPEAESMAELDALFNRLRSDPVLYYTYSDWMDDAFYSILSPCRNVALFTEAVDRIVSDGILDMIECEPFLQQREWIQYNQAGQTFTIPGVSSISERTLVLVLDLSCPSCRKALSKLADAPEWAGIRRIAIGCGQGPDPGIPGWDYLFPEHAETVFDIRTTPVFFVVAPDGTVEIPYTPAL